MTYAYVGNGALAVNNTTATLPVVAPTGLNDDDILLCQLINKSVTANAFTPPDASWAAVIATEVNDCTTAADDHQYGLYWRRAKATDSGATFNFTKATDDNLLMAGVISAHRGCKRSGSPLNATAAARTETVGAADNVTFPAHDPAGTNCVVLFMAYYGQDVTTFAAAMSADTNPDCTTRYDLESATGNDCSLACTSGTNDGTAVGSRTWASAATTDAGNTGVVFAMDLEPVAGDAPIPNEPNQQRLPICAQ